MLMKDRYIRHDSQYSKRGVGDVLKSYFFYLTRDTTLEHA